MLNHGPITVALGAGFYDYQPPLPRVTQGLTELFPEEGSCGSGESKQQISMRNQTTGKKITNIRRDAKTAKIK